MMYRRSTVVVLLVVLALLCVGNEALHSLFPIDIGLMEEDPVLPLERDTFDDCHLRYARYGRDDWTIRDGFPPYKESRDYSHIAAIGRAREGGAIDWSCMGALIWDSVVLTTAQCTIGEGKSAPNVVRLGGPTYVQQRNIKEIVRHPDFSASTGHNDIALVRLDGRIVINETAVPTCLWLWEEVPFSTLDSLLRTTDSDEPYAAEELNRLNVRSEDCSSPTTRNHGLPETQLCMKTQCTEELDEAECNETPEGNLLQVRLLHNYKTSPFLVGILSTSFASGTCNPVRGYTKIAPYRDWMMQVLGEQNLTAPPQAFFPAVCAYRYAQFRPRVEYLMNERLGDIPINDAQVESTRDRDLGYIVQFEWPSEENNASQPDCAGTFVDQQTILTLASCVSPATSDGSQPSAAIHVMSHKNQSYPIESITVHPQYVRGSHKNNIAVVKLMQTRQNIVPSCIWRFPGIPDVRFDLTGIGVSSLNHYQDDSFFDPTQGGNTIVQHAMNMRPFENCIADLVELIGNRSLKGLSANEHLCFHSDRWLVPGVCRDIVGGPVLRYVDRGGAYFKYLYAMTVGGRTCGYGQPTVAIQLAPHYAWLQSVMFDQRSTGVAEPSDSVIVINPDLKRSDECSNVAWRGEKILHLKDICDTAMDKAEELGHRVQTCIVVSHINRVTPGKENWDDSFDTPWRDGRDFWWHQEMEDAEPACYPEWMSAEDPLFMLYTSGSTGKPKGVLHTTAGYLLYAATTFKIVFDYKPLDIYWCTADIGWITGHTYVLYGPLANGATSVMFEGTPFFPDTDRYWEIIDKYKVTQFYTAPTAIRSLMKFGDEPVLKHDLSTLRVLGSVGEPINPEAWLWYYRVIGKERCSIVDTFWQTETGGHVITPLPGATPMKPGSASFPFFGVKPTLLDESGTEIKGEGEGYLVFSQPWPGMMRTLFNNHPRYESTYFSKFNGYYCTGDGARRDADGYYWVTGRVDDMLNVSGHLMSTSEVESVLTEHPRVSEAAVVSRPHPVKGECLYCFITPNQNETFDKTLISELKVLVRERIGPFAQPDVIQHAPGLPKTRSGKIMRRVLRKVAINDRDVGDTSTLADEAIIEQLFANRPTN